MARRSKFGRWQVWNQPADAYKHTDLAYNWDQLDLSIGGPNQSPTFGVGDDFNNPTTTSPTGSGQWLYPQDGTQITNFGNRTLYNIVRGLDFNDVPLGTITMWWRPNTSVPLPAGWVPCDGSTYTGTGQHSYAPTSVTVPDLRNVLPLGAYMTTTGSSTVAINRDGTPATSVDSPTSGPGIGAVGGTNVPRAFAHTHGIGTLAIAGHTHSMSDHDHSMAQHFHGMQHTHLITAPSSGFGGVNIIQTVSGVVPATLAADFGLGGVGIHTHSMGFVSGYAGPDSAAGIVGYGTVTGPAVDNTGTLTTTGGMTSSPQTGSATAGISGVTASALGTVDMMPRTVGLLYIIKIRRAGPLHNTAFPTGP